MALGLVMTLCGSVSGLVCIVEPKMKSRLTTVGELQAFFPMKNRE